jgi:heterotetrameric sarcosine oxidase gamma subunit
MVEPLTRRSALAHFAPGQPRAEGHDIVERPLPAIAWVQGGGAPDLPAEPNTVRREGATLALWWAPGQWLVQGDDEAALVARYQAAGLWACGVGDGFVRLDIGGAQPAELLAHGCPLDLRAFGPERSARSLLARLPVTLWREGDGFSVLVEATHAEALWRWLMRTAGSLPDRAIPMPAAGP